MSRYLANYTRVCADCSRRVDRLDGERCEDRRWRCFKCIRVRRTPAKPKDGAQ